MVEEQAVTVFAAIGNSDDKLSQRQWSAFYAQFVELIRAHALAIHGEWVSEATAAVQNACICFEVSKGREPAVRAAVAGLRASYLQDSVAWCLVDLTEFI